MHGCHVPCGGGLRCLADAEQREGGARCRTPPDEARDVPGHHVLVCHGPHAALLTWRSGEGRVRCRSPPDEARDRPGAPRARVPHLSRCSADAKQLEGTGTMPLPAGRKPGRAGAPPLGCLAYEQLLNRCNQPSRLSPTSSQSSSSGSLPESWSWLELGQDIGRQWPPLGVTTPSPLSECDRPAVACSRQHLLLRLLDHAGCRAGSGNSLGVGPGLF